MNTHILSDVEMLCDRVAIIVKGAIRYEGAPHEFARAATSADADVVLDRRRAEPSAQRSRRASGRAARRRRSRRAAACRRRRVERSARRGARAGATVVSVTPHRASLERSSCPRCEQRSPADEVARPRSVRDRAEHRARGDPQQACSTRCSSSRSLLIGAGVLLSTLSYVESERILQDVGFAAIRALRRRDRDLRRHRPDPPAKSTAARSSRSSRSRSRAASSCSASTSGSLLTLWLQIGVMGLGLRAVSLARGRSARRGARGGARRWSASSWRWWWRSRRSSRRSRRRCWRRSSRRRCGWSAICRAICATSAQQSELASRAARDRAAVPRAARSRELRPDACRRRTACRSRPPTSCCRSLYGAGYATLVLVRGDADLRAPRLPVDRSAASARSPHPRVLGSCGMADAVLPPRCSSRSRSRSAS